MKHRVDMSAIASAARELLTQGDAVGAERVLSPIFNELRSDASVLHLMGQIQRALNKMEEAERYLRRAVAETLSDGTYYNDLAGVLQARGNFDEAAKFYRASAALLPQASPVRVNLVRCLIEKGDLAEAERESRAYIDAIGGPEAWTLLGMVQRMQGRYEDALASASAALKLAPQARGLRHNHAIGLERLGRWREALGEFEQLAREDLETPELAVNFARALYHANRKEEAEQVLEQAVDAWPLAQTAYAALARMRFLRGETETCAIHCERAINAHPNDVNLRIFCADLLHREGVSERAVGILQAAQQLAPQSPVVLSALGIVLDESRPTEEGLECLRRADKASGGAPQARRNLLTPLLRHGRAEEALSLVRHLRRDALGDSWLMACETTALRLLGDPSYRALCDYEKRVRVFEVPAPTGFFTSENFNAALADSLRVLFLAAHPLDQTRAGVVRTPRDLRHIEETNIKEFFKAIDAPIRRYVSSLRDHPVMRRKRDTYRFGGCWAHKLTAGGFLTNHVHDHGWISSAYYAEAPKGEGRSGWLKIGETPFGLRDCGPEKWIEPKPGLLVLFPSFFWHGVEPVGAETNAQRISISFDVIPA